ncbi:MAG: glycosyltransferase family 2 protein [Longimicrobiales bacterium]
MPCLNEAETVGRCVREARRYLADSDIRGEVVVVDNGSSDASPSIAKESGARVVHQPIKGYGSALAKGIAEARGRYVIMGDADGSYGFSALDAFVGRLREGHDLVVGNRFRGEIEQGAMPFLNRYVGNPVLSGVGRLLFRSGVGDFHCGLRGFRRESIKELELVAQGMEFASEMIVRATLAGLRVTEVTTTLSPDGRSRRPHLRPLRDGLRHLWVMLLLSPRWLFLYPGLTLMTTGLAVTLWLIPGARTVGGLTLDVNTLVFACAALLLGAQAAGFSVLARVYASRVGLLRPDPRQVWVERALSVPLLGAAGLILAVSGLAGAAYAVEFWGQASFGPLDPTESLRIVAPSATAMILGLQLLLVSFFLGLLELDLPPTDGPRPRESSR